VQKVTKDFFGKRTPKSPYFEEKKSLQFATFLNKYILRTMFLREIKSKAAIFWGGKGLNSPYLEGAKKF